MSSEGPRAKTAARGRVGPAGRRFGYAVEILVGVALLYGINVWPGWKIVPFLTEDFAAVVDLINTSLVVGIVVNAINLVFDRTWLRAIGDLVTLCIGVVVLVRFWAVFPFDFPDDGFDWALIVTIVLGLAILGSAVGIVVQVVILIRAALGLPDRAAG